MSYAIQSKNGVEQNKLYHDDTGIHDWYRFVLSYPPHLVRNYINKFQLNNKHTVLDPFCGTGTTLVESKKLGIPSIGIESNPVVQMAAKAKVNWTIESDALINHSLLVAREVEKQLKIYGNNLKILNPEREKLIIKNSISPVPLHKSLVFLEVLNKIKDRRFYDIERTAFAKQLVYSYSNLRFGPEVGVSRKKKSDAEVLDLWLKEINKIATDLKKYASEKNIPSEVYLGDSRAIGGLLDKESVDAIITSPPYPNEKDYTRTTRLESVLLDFVVVKSDLRQNKTGLLCSNTRNVYKGDEDEKWIFKHQHIIDLANSIEAKRIELGKTSGFERLYHKVVKNYFGGIARHLEQLRPVLRPNAQLAYVVGEQASFFRILIPTGSLLSDIAVEMGYELIGIELFRTRLSTATKAQLREEVVLLRWKG
jgi:DNA modification methylase